MKKWELVNLPHTVQLVPSEASGSRNYQGPAWYSKRFTVDTRYQGKRLSLYFEAVMGKSSFYINGYKVKEHFGGFLPGNFLKAELQKSLKCGFKTAAKKARKICHSLL